MLHFQDGKTRRMINARELRRIGKEKEDLLSRSQLLVEEEFGEEDLGKVRFLLECGYDLSYALENYERVRFYRGFKLKEMAQMLGLGQAEVEGTAAETTARKRYLEVTGGVLFYIQE